MDHRVCGACGEAFVTRRVLAYLVDAALWGSLFGGMCNYVFSSPMQQRDPGVALSGFLFGPLLYMSTPFIVPITLSLLLASHGDEAVTQGVAWMIVNFSFLVKDAIRPGSPGKRLFGLQAVDLKTLKPVTLRQSIRRNLILLTPVFLGHVLVVLTLRARARLGEGCARTMVIWLRYQSSSVFMGSRVCRWCRYDLTGNATGRCPECGTAIQPSNSS